MPKFGLVAAVEYIKKIRPDVKIIFSTGYDKYEALDNEVLLSK